MTGGAAEGVSVDTKVPPRSGPLSPEQDALLKKSLAETNKAREKKLKRKLKKLAAKNKQGDGDGDGDADEGGGDDSDSKSDEELKKDSDGLPLKEMVAIRAGAKSQQEIEQHTVDETIPELQRCASFVAEGHPLQQLSVIDNFPALLMAHGDAAFDRIVPLLTERRILGDPDDEGAGGSSEEFQRRVAEVLQRIAAEQLTDRIRLREHVLPLVLVLLEHATTGDGSAETEHTVIGGSSRAELFSPPPLGALLSTMRALLPTMPRQCMPNVIAPLINRLGGVTQTALCRSVAARLIGPVCEALSGGPLFFSGDAGRGCCAVMDTVFMLCQDTCGFVRRCMAEQLRVLINALVVPPTAVQRRVREQEGFSGSGGPEDGYDGEALRERLLEELHELLKDDEVAVRGAALETLCALMPILDRARVFDVWLRRVVEIVTTVSGGPGALSQAFETHNEFTAPSPAEMQQAAAAAAAASSKKKKKKKKNANFLVPRMTHQGDPLLPTVARLYGRIVLLALPMLFAPVDPRAPSPTLSDDAVAPDAAAAAAETAEERKLAREGAAVLAAELRDERMRDVRTLNSFFCFVARHPDEYVRRCAAYNFACVLYVHERLKRTPQFTADLRAVWLPRLCNDLQSEEIRRVMACQLHVVASVISGDYRAVEQHDEYRVDPALVAAAQADPTASSVTTVGGSPRALQRQAGKPANKASAPPARLAWKYVQKPLLSLLGDPALDVLQACLGRLRRLLHTLLPAVPVLDRGGAPAFHAVFAALLKLLTAARLERRWRLRVLVLRVLGGVPPWDDFVGDRAGFEHSLSRMRFAQFLPDVYAALNKSISRPSAVPAAAPAAGGKSFSSSAAVVGAGTKGHTSALPLLLVDAEMMDLLGARLAHIVATLANPEPLRREAVTVIATIARRHPLGTKREEMASLLTAMCAHSRSHADRIMFLDALQYMLMPVFSREWLRRRFVVRALELAKDPVPNVRRRLVSLLPALKLCIVRPSKKAAAASTRRAPAATQATRGLPAALTAAVAALANDADKDVRAAMQRSEMVQLLATIQFPRGRDAGDGDAPNTSASELTAVYRAMRAARLHPSPPLDFDERDVEKQNSERLQLRWEEERKKQLIRLLAKSRGQSSGHSGGPSAVLAPLRAASAHLATLGFQKSVLAVGGGVGGGGGGSGKTSLSSAALSASFAKDHNMQSVLSNQSSSSSSTTMATAASAGGAASSESAPGSGGKSHSTLGAKRAPAGGLSATSASSLSNARLRPKKSSGISHYNEADKKRRQFIRNVVSNSARSSK